MRRLTSRVAVSVRAGLQRLSDAQGVLGVLCLAGGTYLLLEQVGAALLVIGVFLLLGAWANR